MSSLKESLRPEILNRLDKIIIFRPLDKEAVAKIVDLQLDELSGRIKAEGISLQVEPAVKELIAERGFDPNFGARPIRRALVDLIEDPLSEKIIQGLFKSGDRVKASLKKDKSVHFSRLN